MEFWEYQSIYNYLQKLLTYSSLVEYLSEGGWIFLIFFPKQHITTDRIEQQIGKSRFFLITRQEDLQEHKAVSFFLLLFFVLENVAGPYKDTLFENEFSILKIFSTLILNVNK